MHNGLPLRWRDGLPLLPGPSVSRELYLLTKRGVDVAMSISALIMLAPLLLAIMLAIRLSDPGPVFFRQVRTGQGGRPFLLYKFRTMRADCCDDSGVEQTRDADARVTRFGQWLRQTSLDELPQLINILRGEMSIVGPRPHVPGQLAAGVPYRELVAYYDLRTAMRPGLTGWAQANGYRGPTTDAALARARVDHDLAYLQNASLLLDLRIVVATAIDEFIGGSGS